jgi:DNA-binding response OmpR family regulator
MPVKILVADDERHLADTLSYAFKREGYVVFTAYDGREAYDLMERERPMVAVLDVSMPHMTGYDILKAMDETMKIGVILLTARNDMVDKILGLEFGADDYITKPFDLREVLARVAALVRRMEKTTHHEVISRGVQIDVQNRTVMLYSQWIELTPKEFDLLWLLINSPNQVFSREVLLDRIWTLEYEGGIRTVDIHIQRIRKKLGAVGDEALQTVYKVGYKWVGEQVESS